MRQRDKLKELLDAHGHTQNDLAELLGITYQSVSIKINRKSEFTQGEIALIAHTYNLTPEELYNIFFSVENIIE